MKKIYEANKKEKRDMLEALNEIRAFDRAFFHKDLIGIEDIVMVGRTNEIPLDLKVNIHWGLNGLLKNNGEIIIIEQFKKQINNGGLVKISETDTYFNESIKLSDKSIILMSIEKYNKLCEDPELKKELKRFNIRLYEGEEDLAVKMIFYDKGYIYLDLTEDGYSLDKIKHPDIIKYTEILLDKQKQIFQNINKEKKYNYEESNSVCDKTKNNNGNNFRRITGLTNEVEGDADLDDELYASIDIGKVRENQEDAVLLIKDKENPKFRMMVLADGMGGHEKGEVASDILVSNLKDWFENLRKEEKNMFYTDVVALQEILQKKIKEEIEVEIENKTGFLGGTTFVCAVIGKNNTLISNIGDSKAYIIKDCKIRQLSRDDTVVQEKIERGEIKSKEEAIYDEQARELTQCIGMGQRYLKNIHFKIIKNNEYDMLLLFSDGVTNCLTDEDIVVVCKDSNREEVVKQIVEKALRKDSIKEEGFYNPGGQDNTTAVAFIPNSDNEIER